MNYRYCSAFLIVYSARDVTDKNPAGVGFVEPQPVVGRYGCLGNLLHGVYWDVGAKLDNYTDHLPLDIIICRDFSVLLG